MSMNPKQLLQAVTDLVAANDTLTAQVTSLTSERDSLKASLAACGAKVIELGKTVDGLNTQVAAMVETIKALQAKIDELTKTPPPLPPPPPPPDPVVDFSKMEVGRLGKFNGVQLFPKSSWWRRPVTEQIDPSSEKWLESIGGNQGIGLKGIIPESHGRRQGEMLDGLPYTIVDSSTPMMSILYDLPDLEQLKAAGVNTEVYRSAKSPTQFRIPNPPFIQGTVKLSPDGPAGDTVNYICDGDKHLIVINKDDKTALELWNTYWLGEPNKIHAGSGIVWDLTKDDYGQCPMLSGASNAANVPYILGAVRWEDMQAGRIDHALAFTCLYGYGRAGFVTPALNHQWNNSNNPDLPPMGARLVLRPEFDISKFGPQTQLVLKALKEFGMIYMDGGHPCDLIWACGGDWDVQQTLNDLIWGVPVNSANFYWQKLDSQVYSGKDQPPILPTL